MVWARQQITSNQPQWDGQIDRPFQEVWYLKLVSGTQGFWLRFTLLINPKEKKFIAETWAILFTRTAGGAVNKIACKETYPLGQIALENFSAQAEPFQIRIGTSFMEENRTVGNIPQHRLHWDLRLENSRHLSFNFVPPSLRKSFLVKNYVTTPDEDLRCSGVVELGSQRLDWNQAPGMRGHLAGPQNGHSWVWGHGNSFVDEHGNPSDLVVDALSARARLGKNFSSPVLTTCFFHYHNQNYTLCSLWGALTTASRHSDTGWQFLVPFGEMSFSVQVSAQLQDFAGLTYEDTDGSLLYCANAKLADMSVEVRHRGHLQGRYRAKASAAFEVVTRTQNPLIPLLL